MQSASVMIFTIVLACIGSAFAAGNRYNVSNATCETENALCRNDTVCDVFRIAFDEDCAEVLNSTVDANGTRTFQYQAGSCPGDCLSSLESYLLYLYPNTVSFDVNFCDCGSADCSSHQQQLIDQRCIASDCSGLWATCQNDPTCKLVADEYQDKCGPLGFWNASLSWSYNFCPAGCKDALEAYANATQPGWTSLRFCDCNGDINCEKAKDLLESVDCATPDCEDMYADCLADPVCSPIAADYVDACGPLFGNSNWTSPYCPVDCEDNFQAYLDVIAPNATSTDFCTCSSTDCDEGKEQLLTYGCVGNDCQATWAQCQADPACKLVADEYVLSCTDVLSGTWTDDFCPGDCQEKLAAYIALALTNLTHSNPEDYCDCNGDSDCITGRDLLVSASCLNVGCSALNAEKCTSVACIAANADFLAECTTIVDGTWTDDFCPVGCQLAMREYFGYLLDDGFTEATDISGICDCGPNDMNCESFQTQLVALGCSQPSCQVQYALCQSDPDCAPLATTYLNDCQSIINGSFTGDTCPSACADSFAAYLGAAVSTEAVVAGQYCNCDGEAVCETVLETYIEIGCIQQNCAFEFAVCSADSDCENYATEQVQECAGVYNGSQTECPDDCRRAISSYLYYVYPNVDDDETDPAAFCDCDGNTNCVTGQANLDAAGCIDPTDCEVNHIRCLLDDTCAPIAEAYLMACDAVLNPAMGSVLTECPDDCSAALLLYLETVFGAVVDGQGIGGYCNCNGQAGCVSGTAAIMTLDCLGLETTTMAPVTTTPQVEGNSTTSPEAGPGDDGDQSKACRFGIAMEMLLVVVTGLFVW